MVNTLSDYYKTLKQYQDADADAFEASGKDSDDEPEGIITYHFIHVHSWH
jgi:hypothetical protein